MSAIHVAAGDRWKVATVGDTRLEPTRRRERPGLVKRGREARATDGVHTVIHWMARLNWHRDLILALLRQRGLARFLFRVVFR